MSEDCSYCGKKIHISEPRLEICGDNYALLSLENVTDDSRCEIYYGQRWCSTKCLHAYMSHFVTECP